MKSDDPWFIARDGQQHGPLDEAEMKLFVERGHLRATDLLWRQGFPDWRPAFSVFPPKTQPTQPQAPSAPPASPSGTAHVPGSQATHSTHAHGPGPAAGGANAPMPTHRDVGSPAASQTSPQPQPGIGSHNADAVENGFGHDQDIEIPPAAPRRGKAIATTLMVGAVAGAGLWYYVNGMPAFLGQAGTATTAVPVVKAPKSADATQKAKAPAPTPAAKPARIDIDKRLQQAELWQFLKSEYPSWYASVLKNADQLDQNDNFERKLSELLVSRVIELRRRNADKVLSAGPQNLMELATAFLANLKYLSGKGAEPCFAFISKGEASPSTIEAMRNPAADDVPIYKQLMATFKASVAGSKTPVTREAPQKSDYQALTSQLAKIGWNKEDIQLFANPKALSQAPPARVCQMVQDWFTAHLNLENAETQERLLHETLRPVVSG